MEKQLIHALIGILALVAVQTVAYAQDMSFSEEEAAEEGDDMTFEEEATEEEAPAEEQPADETETSASEIDAALGDDFSTALDVDEETQEAAEVGGEEAHPIWAVQQVYAVRARRFDLQPSFGFSLNDPYVQHQAISAGLNYFLTEVLAVGVSFNFYRWLQAETDTNFSVRRAAHQAVPINEYFWGGQLNFTYVPIYGKFTMFRDWIMHWDVWVSGGGGFIFTRPYSIIDPDYREFPFKMKFAFNVGIGGRMFLTRFLAIYLEMRDYIFPEELENTTVYATVEQREDKSNWYGDTKLTNNIMMHVGVSIFLPPAFEYKLPK